MYKIAVLGDRESICGFACLGVETVNVSTEAQAKEKFRFLVNENYAIIYITEYYADILKEDISRLDDAATPAVILIPGVTGNTGKGMDSIDKSVIRAVGSLI